MRTVLLLCSMLAAVGCFKGRDPLYCLESSECPSERPICDLSGELEGSEGLANTCVAASACATSAECTSPAAPICDGTQCLPCGSAGGDTACAAADPAAPICGSSGACVQCDVSSDCAVNQPICESGACLACGDAADADACSSVDASTPICATAGATEGRCVECTSATAAADCTNPDRPICGDDGLCKGCIEHSDCSSAVCDRSSGACVAESDVYYVAEDGLDGVACGSTVAPCATIAHVIGKLDGGTRHWIKLGEGIFSSATVLVSGKTAKLIGTASGNGTTIDGNGAGAVIDVDNGSSLLVEEATVSGGTDGINCSDTTSSLRIYRATVGPNTAIGIDVDECSLTVARTSVQSNDAGGIDISNAPFDVQNNMIMSNGTAGASGSSFGGVAINNNNVSNQVFEFNTVADSLAASAATAAGLQCQVIPALEVSNNIIFLRTGGAALLSGNCTHTYSVIEGGMAGTGNVSSDPMFVSTGTGDYRIQPGSPAEDAADPSSTLLEDFDGDLRPQGAGRDIGADEVPR